jgi:hypothetical protein
MSNIEQQQAAQLAAQQSQLLQQKQALAQAQAHIAHLQQQAASVAAASSSSSSSSSSPPPLSSSSTVFPSLSPNRPSPFSGSIGSDAEHWLMEMERYFLASGNPLDSASIVFTSTYLRESASMWFSAKYKGMSQLPDTWKLFREEFLFRFRPFAAARTARASLRCLTQLQEGSVSAYSDSFLRLIQLLPDMHVQDQLDAYLHGLQPRLAEAVDRAEPKTLEAAIYTAQREEIRNRDRAGRRSSWEEPEWEVQPVPAHRFGVENGRPNRTQWPSEVPSASDSFGSYSSFRARGDRRPFESESNLPSESVTGPWATFSNSHDTPSQSSTSASDPPSDMDLSHLLAYE